jgi:hypothetical protein
MGYIQEEASPHGQAEEMLTTTVSHSHEGAVVPVVEGCFPLNLSRSLLRCLLVLLTETPRAADLKLGTL